MSDKTTLLVQGSGSHRAPHLPGVSYLRGNVSKMNLNVSQQILYSKEKKKKDPFFCVCQKLWTCWLSILRTKLLIYFFLINKSK